MQQEKPNEPKRKPGRPAVEGRRVLVKLSEAEIARARQLGNGKITLGIRAALAQSSG